MAPAPRAQHPPSASAAFRSLGVITAQQFELISASSPARRREITSASPFQFRSSPGSAAQKCAAAEYGAPQTGRVTTSIQTCHSRDDGKGAASPQIASDVTSDPPSNGPAGYGLSREKLRHLAALTAANDSPRRGDSASAGTSVFHYQSSSHDGPSPARRPRRLSLDSAQRRLDSWNRFAAPPQVAKREGDIRANRHKRCGSAPPAIERGGGDGEGARLVAPLEAMVSEARKQAIRQSLRRTRSAHILGGKGTDALWHEAMTAVIWRRGGAYIYRRPADPAATPSGAPSGAEGGGRVDSRGGAAATAVEARQNQHSSSSSSSSSSRQRFVSPRPGTSFCGTTISYCSYSNESSPRSPALNAGRGGATRSQTSNRLARTASPLSVPGQVKNAAKSVFAWAAEQRMANRRALNSQ